MKRKSSRESGDNDDELLRNMEILEDEPEQAPADEVDDLADDLSEEKPLPEAEREPLSSDTQQVIDALEAAGTTFRQAICALLYITDSKAAGKWKPALPPKRPKGGMSRPGLIAYIQAFPEYAKDRDARKVVSGIAVAANRSAAQLFESLADEERLATENGAGD